MLEINSSGCHDDIDRVIQLPSKYTFTSSWTAGKLTPRGLGKLE